MSIESKLDETMEAKGITVDQLIEKTGLPRMTIFNARRGMNVTIKTALKISEALEVQMEEVWSIEAIEQKDGAENEDADVSTR